MEKVQNNHLDSEVKQHAPVVLKRINDSKHLDIMLAVDPNNHEWHETSLGPIQVESLVTSDSRSRILRLRHRSLELARKRDVRWLEKYSAVQEIEVDENGHGLRTLPRTKQSIEGMSLKPVRVLKVSINPQDRGIIPPALRPNTV